MKVETAIRQNAMSKWHCRSIILLVILLLIPLSVFAQPLSLVVTKGKIDSEFGSIVEYTNFHDSSVQSKRVSWVFGELQITSGEWNGLQTGFDIMVPLKIWDGHSSDYSDVFADDYVIRDLFLAFTIPGTKTKITGGRSMIVKSPATDGDSHRGLQLQVDDFERVKLSASIVDRWINNADTISMSARGITAWENVDDVAPYSDSYFYSTVVAIDCIPKLLSLTPFFNWQNDIMGAIGSKWDFTQELEQDFAIGFDGSYTRLINDHPRGEKPDYEDVNMMRFHTSIKYEGDPLIGVGYFAYGKGNLDTSIGVFAGDDPLDRDDFVGYDDRNDTHLWYLDFYFMKKKWDINGLFGFGRNNPNDTDFLEADFWVFYNITKHLKVGGYLVYTKYNTNIINDYLRLGSALTYSL